MLDPHTTIRTFPFACSPPRSNFKMIQDYSSVVLLDFLSKDELLVMENPWEMVRECLPDVLDRKQYGV